MTLRHMQFRSRPNRHRMLAIVQHDFDVLGKALMIALAAGFVVFAVVAAVMDIARIAH